MTCRVQASCLGGECVHGQAPQTAPKLVGGGDDELAHLDERGGAGHSGRLDGVEGIGLATAAPLLPVGPAHLDHRDVLPTSTDPTKSERIALLRIPLYTDTFPAPHWHPDVGAIRGHFLGMFTHGERVRVQ